jgi:uncharacterized protein YebE (UPF0316 family)
MRAAFTQIEYKKSKGIMTLTIEGLLLALGIFVMRVLNYAIGTVRLVAITRNFRLLAAGLAALEALVFAVVIANIVTDLGNIVNLFAYCLGASVGSWAGMMIEARLITSYMIANVITSVKGHEMAVALREAGFGVTEATGEGRDGLVTTLRSVINKRDVPRLSKMVQSLNPEAFIAVEEARGVQRGWVGSGRGPRPGSL